MADAVPPPKLSYRLEALVWDAQHHFNQQNRYGYNGKTWRKYSDPMLMCEMCDQWFACHEVTCLPQGAQFVPFQRNYRFTCRVCGAGQEHFEVLTNTWSSIAMTAMYNLLLTENATGFVAKEKWLKVADVVAWVRAHWGALCMGRDLAQLEENKSINKCLYHMVSLAGKEGPLVQLSDDRAEVKLCHPNPNPNPDPNPNPNPSPSPDPSPDPNPHRAKVKLHHLETARLQIKPLNATTIPAVLLGQALSGKASRGQLQP